MRTLTDEQAATLIAFCECFDLHVYGYWDTIEEEMIEKWGVKNPRDAIDEAMCALRTNST